MRQSFDALRERQFRLLFTGQIVSLFGDALTGVALAFAVLGIGSATDLGYVFAAKTVPLVGFLLVGGVFADRLPRRAVMLVADVVRFGAQGAVAVLVLTHCRGGLGARDRCSDLRGQRVLPRAAATAGTREAGGSVVPRRPPRRLA